MSLRVRFAPSPTGHLHVGGARTALFNWLLARQTGGQFLLRIEDTDEARSSPEMVEGILDGLRWLGLSWDDDITFQSQGLDRHRADVERLLETGWAFRDYVHPEELSRVREEDAARALRYPREVADRRPPEELKERAAAGEPHAVRFRVPAGETMWDDLVHGVTRFQNHDLEDLVLLRTEGTPTYNLAVASDDSYLRITHVLRGDDHISNTPKQILIHRALGRTEPRFAHLPMILGPDGKRLSKRHGATAVGEYQRQGILPEALVNFLALLGWSPGTDEEVLTREELVSAFSLDRVLRKSAVFDVQKLEWLNGRHLANTSAKELVGEVLDGLGDVRREAEARFAGDPDRLLALIDLLKTRARRIGEISAQARPYVTDTFDLDPAAVRKHWQKDPEAAAAHLEALSQRLADAPWDEARLEEALRSLAEERGVGAGKLIHPLRVALTGQMTSPGIFEVLSVLGKERSLERISAAVHHLEEIREDGRTT